MYEEIEFELYANVDAFARQTIHAVVTENKRIIGAGFARCSPGDEYDRDTGAKIAVRRACKAAAAAMLAEQPYEDIFHLMERYITVDEITNVERELYHVYRMRLWEAKQRGNDHTQCRCACIRKEERI